MKKKLLGFLTITLLFLVWGIIGHAEVNDKVITIENFKLLVYSKEESDSIPIKNAIVDIIYYDEQGKKIVETTNSDSSGEIKNIQVKVPDNISKIYFQYKLTNPEIGNLVNSKGKPYAPIRSIPIPKNNIINQTLKTYFINSEHEDSPEYNYQSIKVWNIFQAIVNENRESVNLALDAFPELKENFKVEIKPITVIYENLFKGTNSPVFSSKYSGNLPVEKGTPLISIPHSDYLVGKSRAIQEEWFNVNLSHEWSHWSMYLALGKLAGGSYTSHQGYNIDESLSFKEGWAVFQANRYTYQYNWNWKNDTSVQTSINQDASKGRFETCYGKSTNWTVSSVLRDIYDKETVREPEDQYDLAKDWMLDVTTRDDYYRQKLSNGLMIITMYKSQATTLSEYIQFMKKNNFIKNNQAFDAILNLNGLDSEGRFTLDNEGKQIN